MRYKLRKLFSHPCLFLFVSSFLFLLHFFLKPSFLQLNTINHDLHLRIIQVLCLHFSRSTPLRKTLTVNHCLRIEYYQHKIYLHSVPYNTTTVGSSRPRKGPPLVSSTMRKISFSSAFALFVYSPPLIS